VLNNILDYYGIDAECRIHWQAPYEGDAREMAEAEYFNARASKIRVLQNITSPKEERGRFQGTGRPSPYPMPDSDTAPIDCPTVCDPNSNSPNEGSAPRHRNQYSDNGGGAVSDAGESYQPTKGMMQAAERGLMLRNKHQWGGTIVGVSRARDISNGRSLSLRTVKRMYSYFSRHAVDKQAPGYRSKTSAGYIAWQLWGGDEGFAWCKSIRNRAIKANLW
jgi:hypothetical protein